jgi:hypothetical protein
MARPILMLPLNHFSLLHSVQTGSGTYPASYLMGMGGCFPVGKATRGREADHPPPNAEVKNGTAIPPLPHTSSLRDALL